MDWTTLQHTLITLLFTGLGYLIGNPLACTCFGVALLIGREHTQAEYRWIEKYGNGKRANMPWWGGFDIRAWSLTNLFDWLFSWYEKDHCRKSYESGDRHEEEVWG